ncbi:hypothetical protein B296_00026867, partial [Ensete ventricosum]
MDAEVVVLEEENEVECIDNKHKDKDDHVHVKENGKGDLHIVKHNKDEGDIGPKEYSESEVDVKVEEKVNSDEDLASDSFEMLVDDSDNEQSSASDYDEKAKNEQGLPYWAVRIGLPVDQYADCLLLGGTVETDWKSTVGVDFDHRRLISIGVSRGRKKEEEEEEEGEEDGEKPGSPMRCSFSVPLRYPSLAGEESPARSVVGGRFLLVRRRNEA